MLVFFLRQQQLDADPHQQHGSDKFQVRDGQQSQGEEDQDNTQDYGAGRAPEDAEHPLLGRQLAAGQGDDYRIVAAQKDVNHDDLADCQPEFRVKRKFHCVPNGEIARNSPACMSPHAGTTRAGISVAITGIQRMKGFFRYFHI